MMFIQVKAGNAARVTDTWEAQINSVVEAAVSRFGNRLTSVEVFVSDENSDKKEGEADKRCLMEARIRGLQPVAVRTHAPSFEAAVSGCAEKLERKLDRYFGRLGDKEGQVSQSGDEMMGPLRGPLPNIENDQQRA